MTDIGALAQFSEWLSAQHRGRLEQIMAEPDPMTRAKALEALADDLVVSMAPLRRGGQSGYWRPAPASHDAQVHRSLVYRLIKEGRLVWGNRCHSFVKAVA